jgi:20S proteasome subunit alpha 5
MTLEEAEILAITVLRQVMEEKLEAYNIEVGVVTTKDRTFRLYNENTIANIITKLKPREDEVKSS